MVRGPRAYDYVRERLGELAPTRQTWMSMVRPSWRRRRPALVAARCIPPSLRAPHVRDSFFRIADLDRFIEVTRGAIANASEARV